MRWLLLAALAGCGAADPATSIHLPRTSRSLPPSRAQPRLCVELTAAGHLLVAGHAVSLGELGERLSGRRSELTCVIRADAEASWGHVEWLLAVCAEERVWRIEFAMLGSDGREGVIRWWRPPDRAIEWTAGEPEQQVLQISIGIGADGRFHCGDRSTESMEDVSAWIREAVRRRRDDPLALDLVGEIRSSPTAPWGAAARAFERLVAGIRQVDYYGTRIPSAAERAAIPLRPITPRPLAGRGGIRRVGAWGPIDGYWDID